MGNLLYMCQRESAPELIFTGDDVVYDQIIMYHSKEDWEVKTTEPNPPSKIDQSKKDASSGREIVVSEDEDDVPPEAFTSDVEEAGYDGITSMDEDEMEHISNPAVANGHHKGLPVGAR